MRLPLVVGGSCLALIVAIVACGDDENPAGGGNASSASSSSSSGATSSGTSGESSSGTTSSSSSSGVTSGGPTVPPPASCMAAGGSTTVAAPVILRKLTDDGDEGWLASPAIADVNNDGKPEVIAVRGGKVIAWQTNGQRLFTYNTAKDRVWASPIVADFVGDGKLEIAVAARDSAYLIDSAGAIIQGFPKVWATETRTVAAGDVDGDGKLDVVVGVRKQGGVTDVVNAYHGDGSAVPGFPPVEKGVSGCQPGDTPAPCYFAGLYDQNLAIGDLDGDGKHDLVLPHDNAYASIFKGTGAAFDSNAIYNKRPKTPGVRYMHDLADAMQGFPSAPATDLQAHFTNTPPAIADIDKDGKVDIVMVGSVQTGDQTQRQRGVALWVISSDASRHAGWESPFHVPAYVQGLNDGFAPTFNGPAIAGASNLVGLTNQVTIADIDANKPGLELIFAGYDGRIHAVAVDKTELWSTPYAENGRALTAGVAVADLSGDGVPEIVFTTYSPDQGGGALFILSSAGQQLHKVPLPTRGSMAVPTIGDVDGNGTLSIVVSLKDENASNENVLVYQVPNSKPNCLLWPTGRGNNLRNGWVR